MAEQSFGWRQPVAALIALASALGPLIAAAGWMFGGADGPVERRDPVQVPAFVAEESHTRDQARTLVLDSDSAAHVGYMLVRGSGARLGDGELASGDGGNSTLDKVVANLVAAPVPTRPTSSAGSPCATCSCTRAPPARSPAFWTPRPD